MGFASGPQTIMVPVECHLIVSQPWSNCRGAILSADLCFVTQTGSILRKLYIGYSREASCSVGLTCENRAKILNHAFGTKEEFDSGTAPEAPAPSRFQGNDYQMWRMNSKLQCPQRVPKDALRAL